MDCIIRKINCLIDVNENNTVEMQTLLKERIEYIFYLVLGCLWNENMENATIENRSRIVENLHRMSIGQVVGAIRTLDVNYKYISRKELKTFDKYPELRNQTMGHGYVHNDNVLELEKELEVLYQELISLDFLKVEYDIVCVEGMKDNKYNGIRFSSDGGGVPNKWACPISVLGQGISEESVFLVDSNMKYYRISPFVAIKNKGESMYIFQSLEDKLSGNVRMSQLFRSGTYEVRVEELISVSYGSDRRRISSNKTIMNYFDENYSRFIPVPIESTIENFLKKNRSNVQATVWGHGGVGKTACVQNICMKLFNDFEQFFSYIIFVSAKERRYDTNTGKIVEIKNIRTYEEILNSIIEVIYDEDGNQNIEEKEKKILECVNKVLIVIDDYETFEDVEKAQIQSFIHRLNIDYFKVILTTRNRRLSTGIEIILDELNEEETKEFLMSVFENEYSDYVENIKSVVKDEKTMNMIYNATSGRVIFLYQFANLFAQKGLNVNFIKELKESKNAQEFLYGKIYAYLSEGAKHAFSCISKITEEKDLIFKERVLEYVLDDYENEEKISAIQELIDQKVIEKYDEENYRIYSQELFDMMKLYFENENQSYKDKVNTKLQDIGGISIKGTVYEAMLDEANNSRNQGNVKSTVEKYKRLLNEKECENSVKKRALINLTSYLNITLMDTEGAVAIFDNYVQQLGFNNDVDVLKLYVQYLWSLDDTAKAKACDILERFFSSKSHKKTDINNIELFAMTVTYCSHNVMENTPEKVKVSAENRIFNEYGKELYNYVVSKKFSSFKPSVRHNVSIAFISTARLALELSKQGYDKMDIVNGIIKYGESNFNDLFKRQLLKLKSEIENRRYKEGEEVEVVITYVAKYGLLVSITPLYNFF